MKNLISCDKATIAALADRLKRAKSHAEYQRISAFSFEPRWAVQRARLPSCWAGRLPRCMSFIRAGPRRAKLCSTCVGVVVGIIST